MLRIVKLGVISFIVFFVILYLMSLLIPRHVRISRAINMDATAKEIFPFVADTTKWKQWNEISGGGVRISVVSVDSNLIVTRWQHKGRSITGSFRFEESAGITVVQWYFDFHLKWYPWEKFGSITFDKQFGVPMEHSLENLKRVVGNSP